MKKVITLIVLFMIAILSFSCYKDCRIPGPYQFQLPVTLSPAKDTFHIGDTISVASSFPEELFELQTEEFFTLDDFKFYPKTYLIKWITQADTTINDWSALSEFDVLIDSIYPYDHFYFSSGNIALTGQFRHVNNTYDLKYQLIPKETGLYFFTQDSHLSRFTETQDFPGKCDGEETVFLILFGDDDIGIVKAQILA